MTIDDGGVGKTLDKLGSNKGVAWADAQKILRSVSLFLMGLIKRHMPVDTGRARAGWGIWSAEDLTGADSGASEADAHFEVQDGGTSISQGTNLEYVRALNEGSSTQAPSGFIDADAKAAQDMLMKEVGELVDRLVGQ